MIQNCAVVNSEGIVVNCIVADPEVDSVPDHTLVPGYPKHVTAGMEYKDGKWPKDLNAPPEIEGLDTL